MSADSRNSQLRPGIRRLFTLAFPRKGALAAELQDELQLHLDLRTEQLIRQGVPPALAAAQARERFGRIEDIQKENQQHARNQEQTMRRRIALDSIAQDLTFAARTLARQKAWTTIAVIALGLGIGANTAVFSVVNDLLIDPLRYPEADRIALVSRRDPNNGFQLSPTRKQVAEWKSVRSLEALEGIATQRVTFQTGGEPRTVLAAMISPGFNKLSGARMIAGRAFDTTELSKGAAPVAILSEHVWQQDYGASRDVVGKLIDLNGTKRTIVGVMADGIRLPLFSADPADVWLPITDATTFLSGPAVARLAPGVSIEAAQQELNALVKNATADGHQFEIVLREPGSTGSTRQSVLMLTGAVCLLLLIACANVAHLLLARGATREREIAIRAALGAGRGRIARQLMTESLLLAFAGCIVGLAFGAMALKAMIALRPPNMSELVNVRIDERVLAVTIALSILSGIVFGLVAGLRGKGTRSFGILRSSAGSSGDRRRTRLQSFLVISESALSVVLLVGATLLIRSVINLQQSDPGFDAKDVYALTVSLPPARYADAPSRELFATRLHDAAARIPGVADVTLASNIPTQSGVIIGKWMAEGMSEPPPGSADFTGMNTVRSNYFSLMGMRMIEGRTFSASSEQLNEVVISSSLARQLWGTSSPIGQRMRVSNEPGDNGTWSTVIGLVPDASLLGLGESGQIPAIYMPEATVHEDFSLLVRMQPGRTPHAALRRIVRELEPTMPPPATVALDDLLLRSIANKLFVMSLLTVFAGLAVALCAIGLYGVISYMVSQSTREIGIRVALGAARRDVVQMVMRKGLVLTVAGLAIGVIASMWGTRLLSGSLYGITASDPVSFAAGATVLLALATAACVAPTLRALRIDPTTAMRAD